MQTDPSALVDALFTPALAYKRAEIDAIQARWDETAPLLIAQLDGIVADPWLLDDPFKYGQIYAAYLLASHKVEAAHDTLCAVLRLDGELIEWAFGDTLSEDGGGFLAFTSGGRTEALKALIEDRDAYLYSRCAAADALGIMAVTGQIDPAPVRAYIAGLLTAEWDDGAYFVASMGNVLLDLNPAGFEPVLAAAMEAGRIGEMEYDWADVEAALALDWPTCQARVLRRLAWRDPAELHDHLSEWAYARDEAERLEAEALALKAARAEAAKRDKAERLRKKSKRKQAQKARKKSR